MDDNWRKPFEIIEDRLIPEKPFHTNMRRCKIVFARVHQPERSKVSKAPASRHPQCTRDETVSGVPLEVRPLP